MAEIKSTLELIMEKTRDMTPTDEEKEAFRKKEIQGKVKGLLMKFLDGFLDLAKLKNEISPYEEKDRAAVRDILVHDCLDRIDPDADNTLPFDILKHLAGMDIEPIQTLLSDYTSKMDKERRVYEQSLGSRIREKGISGSAVLPNIEADPDWIRFVQESKTGLHKEMQDLGSN